MRNDCEHIRDLLDSDSEDPRDIRLIEEHLAICPACGEYCELDEELENRLAICLPMAAPVDFAETLSGKLKKDRGIRAFAINDDVTVVISAIAFFAAIQLIVIYGNTLAGLFGSINLNSIKSLLTGTFAGISLPKFDLAAFTSYLVHTPLLLFALISVASLIWVFSLIEFDKTIK